MPKFKVTLTETVTYEIELEADDLEAAEEDAVEIWANCLAAQQEEEFDVQGNGVEITGSWEVK